MQALHHLQIELLTLDVTDDSAVQAVVNTIITNEGKIDVVVNNAGVGCYGALRFAFRSGRLVNDTSQFIRANVRIAARTSSGCL
jgi:NAD(P)-dependent dehydrogenase (short-subunit alcohol dehydrogenase family)